MSSLSYEPAIYEGTNDSLKSAISVDGSPKLGQRYRVPPKCGVAVRLNAGHMISIENTHGTQVCDFWAFRDPDMQEFLSMAHTRTSLESIFPKIGDILVSNTRQPMLKIVENSSNSMYVEKCFFQGKEYKLIGRFKENIWSIISQKPVKVNSEVFFDYSKRDLIFFDKNCSTFFTS